MGLGYRRQRLGFAKISDAFVTTEPVWPVVNDLDLREVVILFSSIFSKIDVSVSPQWLGCHLSLWEAAGRLLPEIILSLHHLLPLFSYGLGNLLAKHG